jgi:hypothetical protein
LRIATRTDRALRIGFSAPRVGGYQSIDLIQSSD